MIGLKVTDSESSDDPTGLYSLLCSIGEHVLQRDWLISDAELWVIPTAEERFHSIADDVLKRYAWVTGATLLQLTQTITVANWGAFLGFARGSRPEIRSVPISESGYFPIQHPAADIEIQAVDGGFFEVYCRDESINQAIRNVFTTQLFDSEDLF